MKTVDHEEYTGQTERPALSICMIVKNEEANLKRCLDSLLPLIHEPWCELVVMDTGSTDRTVDVAADYTPHVHKREFVPWSFSDARNACAEYAKGERIMVMDADEVLLPDSLYILEDVILNPKYDDINTVFFNIRSYVSADLQQYTEMMQPRVFRNDGNPIYSGSVHNRPRAEEPYVYGFTIIVGHYGYLWANQPELLKQKYERSLPLLLEDFEKDPHSVHAMAHLIKTYFLTHENDKVIEFGERFIEEMRTVEYHDGWTAYLEAFVKLLYVYSAQRDVDNSIRVYREIHRYSDRIIAAPYLLAKMYASEEINDRETAAYYFEQCLSIATTEKTLHEALMNNNDRQIVPEALNFLACWKFQHGKYIEAGELAQEGIRLTPPGLPIRWDIWNETVCAERLIKE